MDLVVVLGAGELGGLIAHALAKRSVAPQICLVDEKGRVAEGKALDIMQAAPIERFATRVSGSTDLLRAVGAEIIIVADRAGQSEWAGDEGARLLARLRDIVPSAFLLCAGASQRELIDRAARELHVDRRRMLGTAPEALAAGARALVALSLNASPRDIALTVIGDPPAHTIVAWDSGAHAGRPLIRLLDEPSRRRLSAQIVALWPPGPHALAACAAQAIDALSGRTRSVMSCFVAPEEADRHRLRTAATAVRLGPAGAEPAEFPLSVVDRVVFETATLL